MMSKRELRVNKSLEKQLQNAPTTSGPATIGGSSATKASPAVRAMPKQQKAGTGTFANLRSYLDAAQAGGQQRVAQAATQQVQRLGTGAQKGVQQAQETFRGQLQAGSGAVFQGEGGQALTQEQAAERAQQRASEAISAARAVTYQAPQPQSTVAAGPAVEPTTSIPTTMEKVQAPAPAPTAVPELQAQRFAEIINAAYQGPQSIQQAGLFEPAAQKARAAQQAAELTQTAGGREQLLRDVFGRSRDYSRGASRLDALLLNASEQGVRQLQQQATPALQAQQALQEAQNISANEAAQRAAAIEQIRSGARQQFTQAKTEEEAATEARIGKVLENWEAAGKKVTDLITDRSANQAVYEETLRNDPEVLNAQKGLQDAINYMNSFPNTPGYRNSDRFWQAEQAVERARQNLARTQEATKRVLSQTILSQAEADFLGLKEGMGLYNEPGLIKIAPKARAEELISKDEQLRLAALSQLAQLDQSRVLDAALKYADAEKAGTKTIADVLDREGIAAGVKEKEQQFLEQARRQVVDGGTFAPTRTLYDALMAAGYSPENPSEVGLRSAYSLYPAVTGGFQRLGVPEALEQAAQATNFYNRVNVENRPELQARFNALQDYLASIDPNYRRR